MQNISISDFNEMWRSINNHNQTHLAKIFNFNVVTVGRHSYGGLDVSTFGNDNEKLIIGNFVSIAESVKFILGGNHHYNVLSTFPFNVKFFNHENEAWTKGPIHICDDVWIGYGSTILSGVTIGQGSIVAACSVVTNDIPPYTIYGGNPAKFIKNRFSPKVIQKLLKNIDFSDLSDDKIINLREIFYQEITDENIDLILEIYNREH
jgi:acetyltransferase-like isoleucine patch superfamily enzyme